jgi:hypothetical protein
MSFTHPDYDNQEFFNTLLANLKADGFDDISYKNDTCPSMGVEFDQNGHEGLLQIHVEYKDFDLREYAIEECPSCVIANFSIDGEFVHSLSIDTFDLDAALQMNEEMRKFILLQVTEAA